MKIPFEPVIYGIPLNIHLILEYTAFIVAFRYYVILRRTGEDPISSEHRLNIILGAVIGAFLGSRIMGFLENPFIELNLKNVLLLLNTKTIMGGLFGGLIGVEVSKKLIGEKRRSGDLFTMPIIVGIFIGRIGCFLSGIKESTYGLETNFFMGMDLGDGLQRHPVALYEMIFLGLLFFFLRFIQTRELFREGMLFQVFMILYFSFRFFIEFIKPNLFYFIGLSSIQWLCLICLLYYHRTIFNFIQYAGKKVHIL